MLKNYCFDLEESASRQLDELVASGIFGSEQIAIMPDAHTGAGCVIGLTAKATNKVVPNLVGEIPAAANSSNVEGVFFSADTILRIG